jgi:hypothetical protein
MKMREIKRITEVKKGSKWVKEFVEYDELTIYKDLVTSLISKKINCCQYIKSIKRVPNYDGTQTIKVNFDNEVRCIYTIADR